MRKKFHSGRVLLINMPWAQINLPTIQLSILKSSLNKGNILSDIAYLNLRFAEIIGIDDYLSLSQRAFLAEWLFNRSIIEDEELNNRVDALEDNYIHEFLSEEEMNNHDVLHTLDNEKLKNIRHNIIPRFFEEFCCRTDFDSYDIIGFTCTFNQTIPAIALANIIKKIHPEKTIILGGSSVEGVMGVEYLKRFPWIDYCVDGEGEITLVELVQSIRKDILLGGLPDSVLGISYRSSDGIKTNPSRLPLANLDESPIPDYDDYFFQVKEIEKRHNLKFHKNDIPFESARGCWWGEKCQCSFCGLNGEHNHFRAKSPARVLAELAYLSNKYRTLSFRAVDNLIDIKYFNELLPALKNTGFDFNIFYELRPNLYKEQLKLLAEAGVSIAQAGIESFHSHILKLMRKGTCGIKNVQFLKWCREYNINLVYNFLFALPGEDVKDYMEMVKLLPLISHLQPPRYPPRQMILERSSPYFNNPDKHSIANIKPLKYYKYLFPMDIDTSNIAFAFDFESAVLPDRNEYIKQIDEVLKDWDTKYYSDNRPILAHCTGPGFVIIYDTRNKTMEKITLSDIGAAVYLFCDKAQPLPLIQDFVKSKYGSLYMDDEVEKLLCQLVDKEIMICESSMYLSLSVPLSSIKNETAK